MHLSHSSIALKNKLSMNFLKDTIHVLDIVSHKEQNVTLKVI
jgi:hypothetical protein